VYILYRFTKFFILKPPFWAKIIFARPWDIYLFSDIILLYLLIYFYAVIYVFGTYSRMNSGTSLNKIYPIFFSTAISFSNSLIANILSGSVCSILSIFCISIF